jgi:hypothetical protein
VGRKLRIEEIDIDNLPSEPLDSPPYEKNGSSFEEKAVKSYCQTQEEKDQDKHDLQMSLSKQLLIVLIVYLIVVLYIVMGNGVDHVIHFPFFGWSLPILKNLKNDPNVLMTLLGTTSANIIGLYLVVVKHLFPEDKAKKD